MPSSKRRALTLGSILLSVTLAGGLSACAGRPVAILSASDCSTLVPTSWREGVPAPAIPSEETVGAWVVFGDLAVGQLDKANARTVDALDIVSRCEARDKAASDRLRPRNWFWPFPPPDPG